MALFIDRRVGRLVQAISSFDYGSFTKALRDYERDTLEKLELDEANQVLAYGVLVELNYASGTFSGYDNRFLRGSTGATSADVQGLVSYLTRSLRLPKGLSLSALPFGVPPSKFESKLRDILGRIHEVKLEDAEYEWLNGITRALLFVLMAYELPSYKKASLPSSHALLDKYSRQTYGISFLELQALRLLVNTRVTAGTPFIWQMQDAEMWKAAQHFILMPDTILTRSLEELIINQPAFFLNDAGGFTLHYFTRPIIYVRSLASMELESLIRRHTNIEGDSFELFIQKYLGRDAARIDPTSADFLQSGTGKQFEVIPRKKVYSRDLPKLFARLPDPYRHELEIDVVANHPSGFSILMESKFCGHVSTSRKYYLSKMGTSLPVQKVMKTLVEYVRSNPADKKVFGIPDKNVVFGAYVTNQHGPFFSIQDGLLKVSAWEVFLEGYLTNETKRLST